MKLRWLAFLILTTGLAFFGCKDSGGDGVESLMVVGTLPEDGDSAVHLEASLQARLSAEVEPSTLTTQTFHLAELGGAQVPGSVTIGATPDIVVFSPEEPLTIITDYTATVTTGLLSMDGRSLAEDFEWDFRTLDDEWGRAESIDGAPDSINPALGVDPAGNAFAVWEQLEGGTTSLWGSRFTRAELWSEPVVLETGLADATDPDLAVDAEGNAMAVWLQNEDDGVVWASRYTLGDGWGTPVAINAGFDEVGRNASVPTIEVDEDGNAIALWYQIDVANVGFHVWANRFDKDTGSWGNAENLEPGPPGFRRVARIELGFDTVGNALAAWTRRAASAPAGGPDVIWSNRYTAGAGWATAELVELGGEGTVLALSVAVDPAGNAHLVWEQPDEMELSDVWTNTSTTTAPGWGTPELLETDDINGASNPRVAVGPDGIAHAVWSQSDGMFESIWASMLTAGGDWESPVLIETPLEEQSDDGDAINPRLAVDPNGNVFVVWQQFDGAGFNIWSNRFGPSDGWFSAELIETKPIAAFDPVIAVDSNRHAHAVWTQFDDDVIHDIRTNRFE